MNGSDRTTFMRTVRRALGLPEKNPRQTLPGLFPAEPSTDSRRRLDRIRHRHADDRQTLVDTLMRAAEPANLTVTLLTSMAAASAAIAEDIARTPTEWGGRRQVCLWDHPLVAALDLEAALADDGVTVVTAASAGTIEVFRRQVIDSFVGVTAADWCVADTATLVMRTRPGQPRSVSLVPSIHIGVITVDQIVADFTELYTALRWENGDRPADLTTCMTFVSGPSKTADIEATLVHGAHGPRAVRLFIIDTQ